MGEEINCAAVQSARDTRCTVLFFRTGFSAQRLFVGRGARSPTKLLDQWKSIPFDGMRTPPTGLQVGEVLRGCAATAVVDDADVGRHGDYK